MRCSILTIFLLNSIISQAQFKLTLLTQQTIPKSLTYNGRLKKAVRWTDHQGTHYVIIAKTGILINKIDPNNREAALYAYHFLSTKDSLHLIWKMYNFIKDCSVDLTTSFIKNSFAVTDLDNNGNAEVWLLYKMACRGDVSPSDMKIIMYEKDEKYSIRGRNKVRVSESAFEGGEYTFDTAFRAAPSVFKNYAQALWQKHIMETWD